MARRVTNPPFTKQYNFSVSLNENKSGNSEHTYRLQQPLSNFWLTLYCGPWCDKYVALCGAKYSIIMVINLTFKGLAFTLRITRVNIKNSTWNSYYAYVLCADLRTNTDFCLVQHQQFGFV
jgi:hypothetical protein